MLLATIRVMDAARAEETAEASRANHEGDIHDSRPASEVPSGQPLSNESWAHLVDQTPAQQQIESLQRLIETLQRDRSPEVAAEHLDRDDRGPSAVAMPNAQHSPEIASSTLPRPVPAESIQMQVDPDEEDVWQTAPDLGPQTRVANRQRAWYQRLHSRRWWFDLAWSASCVAAMIALAMLVNQWLFRPAAEPAASSLSGDSLLQELNQARQGIPNLNGAAEVSHVVPAGPVARLVELLPAEVEPAVSEASYIDGPLTDALHRNPTVEPTRTPNVASQVSGEQR